MIIAKVKKYGTPLTAIVAIACVEAYALSKGINGVALTSSIAAIAGIAGFKLSDVIKKQ